jgi:prepilin-type N-terminal cleavage/methylation domain-containing protein
MKTKYRSANRAGFTLLELMIVVGVIGLLSAIAIPSFGRSRDSARLNAIYNNLRVVEAAKEQWALDNNKTTGDPVADVTVLSGYFRGGQIQAVVGETYVPNNVGTNSEADLPAGTQLGPFAAGAAIPAP